MFWWALVLNLCARCEVSTFGEGAACDWDGPCLGRVGGVFAVVMVAPVLMIPFRLGERRRPRQAAVLADPEE